MRSKLSDSYWVSHLMWFTTGSHNAGRGSFPGKSTWGWWWWKWPGGRGKGGRHRPVCESFGLHVSVIIPLILYVHSSIIRLTNDGPGKAEVPGHHFPTPRIKINRNQQGAQRKKWKMQAEDIYSMDSSSSAGQKTFHVARTTVFQRQGTTSPYPESNKFSPSCPTIS